MKVDKGAVRLQIDNSIDGLRAYLSAVNIRNKCKVARETAERQPRDSREAAERQPRGSREAAERQPRGSREAAERQPRDSREAAER